MLPGYDEWKLQCPREYADEDEPMSDLDSELEFTCKRIQRLETRLAFGDEPQTDLQLDLCQLRRYLVELMIEQKSTMVPP